jgi:hypothetical protein
MSKGKTLQQIANDLGVGKKPMGGKSTDQIIREVGVGTETPAGKVLSVELPPKRRPGGGSV